MACADLRLRAVSEEVEELGTEDVRGVETTHYRTTVDLRRYPDLVPPDRRELARRSIEVGAVDPPADGRRGRRSSVHK